MYVMLDITQVLQCNVFNVRHYQGLQCNGYVMLDITQVLQSSFSTNWTNCPVIDQIAFSEIGPDLPVIDQFFF